MGSDSGEANQPPQPFPDSPDPSSNEEFLDNKLQTLRERYSYERLSELSAYRLGAIDSEEEGVSETDFLHNEFDELYNRFPTENSDYFIRRVQLGDDYQDLAPLTLDQKERIKNCHHECGRNLDRARQDALERKDLSGPISKFASWLVDFADALTPVFGKPR